MGGMRTGEKRFWESMVSQSSKGWAIEIPEQRDQEWVPLNDLDCFVYGVDVATGWCVMGSLRASDLDAIAQRCAARTTPGKSPQDMASAAIRWWSAQHGSLSCPEKEAGLTMIAGAVRSSKAFERLREKTDGGRGHWMYLVYTAADESMLSTLIYIGELEAPVCKDLQTVMDLAKWVVAQQLGTPTSMIAKTLESLGGTSVAPSLMAETV